MKKLTTLLIISATSLFAGAPDEALFLEPHLSTLAGKVAFKGGEQLTQEKLGSYEVAISKNIGIHLPSTTHIVSKDECRQVGLGAHLANVADSLKVGGTAVITSPASYGVLFTTGTRAPAEIRKDIDAALATLGTNLEPKAIADTLGSLKEVSRATFIARDSKLELVTDERTLSAGQIVWRKTPEGVSQEIFHSEEEFLATLQQAGLICTELKRPCFFGQVKWDLYNKKAATAGQETLGEAYKEHHPFTIYHVTKKA